ncbi:MAG: hypothetical protein RL095_3159 [Verrucomicrobiota bacterium]|jgi:hypothetical protein
MPISRRTVLISLASFSLLTVLVLVFIVGLPWRWALQQRIADLKARGEPTTMADLKPAAIPENDNGGPLLETIWQDIGSTPAFRQAGYLHSFERMEDNVAAIRLRLGLPSPELQGKLSTWSTDGFPKQVDNFATLMKAHPDLLERFESALRKPHFHFKLDYITKNHIPMITKLGPCRQTINFLSDLSVYQLAIGKPEEAQRCRLLMLRAPLPLDEPPHLMINSLVRVAITGIATQKLARQLPLLSDAELAQLQKAAAELKPWPVSERNVRIAERTFAFNQDSESSGESPFIPWGTTASLGAQIKDSLFRYTAWGDLDFLRAIDHIQAEIDGRPWVGKNSYLWDQSELNWISVRGKLKTEISQLTQFRLALEIERVKRVHGLYPVDLSGISLSHLDADGKPMSYQRLNEGRGASLEFVDFSARSQKIILGDADAPLKIR